jgi:glucose-6-phosphate 1-dehydrogenase
VKLTHTALENPLRAGSRLARTPEPAALVLFGASGDLTRRKLLPALYSLLHAGLLPAGLCIVGVARRPLDDAAFRQAMREAIDEFSRLRPVAPSTWAALEPRLFYHRCDFGDRNGYRSLARRLESLDSEFGLRGNRLYYLATPPDNFPTIAENLAAAGLAHDEQAPGFRRIVLEKPFGHDHASALELDSTLQRYFTERETFRIDHYLGKETVQNILVLRFANGILEPLWNQKYVDHVQITVAEDIGIEGRAGYFESAGILRDIVQNHVLQLLALTAMEAPVAWEADAVRDEKNKVLHAVRPLSIEDAARQVVRGQYADGWSRGERVHGYRSEDKVAPDSTTETYVALELRIENWRWAGVPFYLRAGKRLAKRVTEIGIQFKPVPHLLFDADHPPQPNALVVRIQPDEGITLRFVSKLPGPEIDLRSVGMDFRYGSSFGAEPPEAYERLLLDALLGDASLYIRRDTLLRAWELVDPVEQAWSRAGATGLATYEAGSWGPAEADALLARSGREWRRP